MIIFATFGFYLEETSFPNQTAVIGANLLRHDLLPASDRLYVKFYLPCQISC